MPQIKNHFTKYPQSIILYKQCGCGGTADALAWGASEWIFVGVQIPPTALYNSFG